MLGQPGPLGPRPVAVLASSRRPAVEQYVEVLTSRVQGLLKREGVSPLLEPEEIAEQMKLAGLTDARGCHGGLDCVARIALLLGPRTVVVDIDVGKSGGSLAVILVAVAADSGQVLLTSEFAVPITTYSEASALKVTLFVRDLKRYLDAESGARLEAQPPPDAPRVVQLEPPPNRPQAEEPASPLGARRAVGITLSGGALISAGLAIGLAVVGNTARERIAASLTGQSSSLSQVQLNSLGAQTNDAFTGALIGAIVAGVFTLGAIFFFAAHE